MKIRDMEDRDIFRLVLRLIGLLGLLYECRHIFVMIHRIGSWHLGWLIKSWATTGHTDWSEFRAFVFEVCLFIFGWYLVRGAPGLIKLVFPEGKEKRTSQDASFEN
jgi:hypothetical protein